MLKQFFRRETVTQTDALIDAVLSQMHLVGVTSDEYPELLTYLERLHKLKAEERREPMSRDTIVTAAGNFLSILLIVAYEQKHVLTSKALTLVRQR